jgi:hypothetical protein
VLGPVDILSPNVSLEITGKHEGTKSNDDVVEIEIVAGVWNFFPTNLPTVFKNLGMIYIRNLNLTSLTGKDVKPFANLQYLWLLEHSIPSLDPELLEIIFNMKNYNVVLTNQEDRKFFSVYEVQRDRTNNLYYELEGKVEATESKDLELELSIKKLKHENERLTTSLNEIRSHQSKFVFVTVFGFVFLILVNILSCLIDFRSLFLNFRLGLNNPNANDRDRLMRENFSMDHSRSNGHVLD